MQRLAPASFSRVAGQDDGSAERGAVLVLVGIMMASLMALAALAIDVAQVYATRASLQTAADAAATAAATALPNSLTAEALALQYAAANAGGSGSIVSASDVEVGFWDAETAAFFPGMSPVNGVRITASRSTSNGNPVSTFFAGVIGIDTIDVSAVAVAARDVVADIVIVQDVTVSFLEELPAAVAADKTLIDTFATQYAAGVQIGVVSFARATTDDAPLTFLSTGRTTLHSALDRTRPCTRIGRRGGPCYGTDLGIGIDRAREILATQGRPSPDVRKVIVLVTDGVPCFLERRNPVGAGQVVATAAADRAAQDGIDIFAVTLYEPTGSSHPCLAADPTFNESLARGIGWGTTTTDPAQLDALLASIVDEMPIRLVK